MDKRRVKQFVKNITKMFVLKKETIANVVCIDYNHLLGSPVFCLTLNYGRYLGQEYNQAS